MWLHGVVTSYRQIDAHTAVFAGTITGGSPDYTDTTPAPTTSSPRLSTAARPAARRSDRGARERRPHHDASGDYDMSQGAGIVTGGNLVVN